MCRLLGGLIFTGCEGVCGSDNAFFHSVVGGLLPAAKHILTPGIPRVVIGQGDGFIGRIGLHLHEGRKQQRA